MKPLEIIFFNLPALAGVAVAVILTATAFRRSPAIARKLCIALLCAIALLHLVIFLHATLAYAFFPYEGKSVVEGAMLYNAIQYTQGHQPYHPPEEIPFRSQVYPPGYELALAGLFSLIGASLQNTRLLSLAFGIGTAIIAGLAVWRLTRNKLPSLFASFLVIGLYGVTGQWIEQVRSDAMVQFLIALGLFLSWRPASKGRFPVLGLIFLLIALYTKQVAIFAPAAVALFLWTRSRKIAVAWSSAFAVSALTLFIAMQAWSDGWFAFYTLRVPFAAGTELSKLSLASTFFGAIWLILWGIVISAFSRGTTPIEDVQLADEAKLYRLALAGALLICLLQSLKWGAALNAFIPLVPLIAILGGLAFHELELRLETFQWLRLAVPIAAVAQMAMISYQPVLPGPADRAAQRRIAEWVRASPGDTFVSVFTSHVFLNGKEYFGDDVIMGDLKRAGVWRGSEIVEKARRGEFALMVLRPKIEPIELEEAVHRNYIPSEQIPMRTPLTRWPFMQVYVPRSAPWHPADEQ